MLSPRMDTAQLTPVRQPLDHPDFLFELKHDGFRALAHDWDGQCELVSRKRNAYKSFEELRDNLAKLKVKKCGDRRRIGLPGFRKTQHL
jgi:ATP-dependent DNA ligase